MADDFAAKILLQYGLRPAGYLPPQKGYRNTSYPAELANGRLINIIVYKREPGSVALVRRTNAVGNYAAQRGLPARTTYDDRIVQLSPTTGQFASVYQYLPGTTIPWEAYTMEHLKMLGKSLSDLHAALQGFNRQLPLVHQQCGQQLTAMISYFGHSGVNQAMINKLRLAIPNHQLQQLAEVLRSCGWLPGQQALHMDFVRGNILFQGTVISGIIDFEKAAYGHRLFDIARTLAFLFVDCKYKTNQQISKYFLLSGYHKRGIAALPLNTAQDTKLLEQLLNFFLLHDLYKFLLHNPYESLAHNEHYQRTAALCLKRGLAMPSSNC